MFVCSMQQKTDLTASGGKALATSLVKSRGVTAARCERPCSRGACERREAQSNLSSLSIEGGGEVASRRPESRCQEVSAPRRLWRRMAEDVAGSGAAPRSRSGLGQAGAEPMSLYVKHGGLSQLTW